MDYEQLKVEATRRALLDGIPRRITKDGKIMKYDWIVDEEQDATTD